VEHLLLTSTDHFSFLKNLQIIEKYSHILKMKTTYGLHPHNAKNYQTFFQHFDKNICNSHVNAIGEFGLDYFRMISSREEQIKAMELFLDKAKKYNSLPLFLHERDAFEDFYSLIKTSSSNGVVHCFTGSLQNVKAYLDLGLYIGITGWISDNRRNDDLLNAVKYIPLDRLLIETDCPYLSPKNVIKNIKRNEPKYLPHVAMSIANIKNISLKEVIEKTTQNGLALFKNPL
jgi:TatD DNase family protein